MYFLRKNVLKTRKVWLARIFAYLLATAIAFLVLNMIAPEAGAQPVPSVPCPNPATATPPIRQLRAAWIATVTNINWPSAPGLSISKQQQEYVTLLNGMQQMNMNAVIVQVKAGADAFYPSQYFPWSHYLTGVEGKNPGYDPLAFMIQQAHTRSMEFHAWFNPYRVSVHNQLSQLAPNNPARLHSDWVVSYGGELYFNPGIPAARDYIVKSILEAVQHYDIDAVHLDDYFYPYRIAGQEFPDHATYLQYGTRKFANINDWRRDNVNQFIHELYNGIKHSKPYVKLGVSPFGVWRNKSADPAGSATHAGQTEYDDLYADTRTWIRNNWLDYVAPQIYWNIGFAPAAYDTLVSWWANEVQGKRVELYIGHAAYKINSAPGPWSNPNELPNQLAYNTQFPGVKGDIMYNIASLLNNPLNIKNRLSSDSYRYKALVPVIPWLGGSAPEQVALQTLQRTPVGVALHWLDTKNNNSAYYAIFRFDGQPRTSACSFQNAQYLLATMPRNPGLPVQSYIDSTAKAGTTYTYYVLALDRLHHASQPGNGQSLTLLH